MWHIRISRFGFRFLLSTVNAMRVKNALEEKTKTSCHVWTIKVDVQFKGRNIICEKYRRKHSFLALMQLCRRCLSMLLSVKFHWRLTLSWVMRKRENVTFMKKFEKYEKRPKIILIWRIIKSQDFLPSTPNS